MKTLNHLNNFIVEVIVKQNEKSAEDKFILWKETTLRTQQEKNRLQLIYSQDHYEPRLNREIALETYLEESSRLKKVYMSATTNKKAAALQNWLKHVANIPEELMITPSSIYTFSS